MKKLLYLSVLMIFVSIINAQNNKIIKNTQNAKRDSVIDNDGNIYHIITIGKQVWMVENLKTTKYNDGTAVPLVTDNTEWGKLNTPGYCWYDNDAPKYKNSYGALYNWYAVNTGKLCPTGWHVPTDPEWTILTTSFGGENTAFTGGETTAGGKLKEADTIHWASPNTGANNSSGFTARPGGTRGGGSGTFRVIGSEGGWWSATEARPTYAWYRTMTFGGANVNRDFGHLESTGFSVRCLKN